MEIVLAGHEARTRCGRHCIRMKTSPTLADVRATRRVSVSLCPRLGNRCAHHQPRHRDRTAAAPSIGGRAARRSRRSGGAWPAEETFAPGRAARRPSPSVHRRARSLQADAAAVARRPQIDRALVSPTHRRSPVNGPSLSIVCGRLWQRSTPGYSWGSNWPFGKAAVVVSKVSPLPSGFQPVTVPAHPSVHVEEAAVFLGANEHEVRVGVRVVRHRRRTDSQTHFAERDRATRGRRGLGCPFSHSSCTARRSARSSSSRRSRGSGGPASCGSARRRTTTRR